MISLFLKKIGINVVQVKIFLYLQIFVIMLIVKIDQKTPIEKALKAAGAPYINGQGIN